MSLPSLLVRSLRFSCALSLLFTAAAAEAQVPAQLPNPDVVLRATGEVSSIARQNDGGLFLVGSFTEIDGVSRDGLARLRPDGSLDLQWYPRVSWDQTSPVFTGRRVYALPDGSVLVNGDVSRVDGQQAFGCGVRLSADPSPVVDLLWHQRTGCPNTLAFDDAGHVYISVPGGTLRRADAATGQVDQAWVAYAGWSIGSELVYDGSGGIIRRENDRLVRRLTLDGTIDPNWNASAAPADDVSEFFVDHARGALYVSYGFSAVRKHALATGQLDSGWNANSLYIYGARGIAGDAAGDIYVGGHGAVMKLSGSNGALLQRWAAEGINRYAHDLAALPDGRIVVSGSFARLGESRAFGLAALTPAGTQPLALAAATLSGGTGVMARQPDGSIVVSGTFDSVDGLERRRLFRLRPDGELDPAWAPFVDGWISGMVADSHGDIYVIGTFSSIDDTWLDRAGKIAAATGTVVSSWTPSLPGASSGIALDDQDRVYLTEASTYDQLAYRISPDGDVDATWRPEGRSGSGTALVRLDDHIYVSIRDPSRTTLHRISIAGAVVDPDWMVDLAGGAVSQMIRADDGDLILGGSFNRINGAERYGLARVSATAPSQLRAWSPLPNNSFVSGLAQSPGGRAFVSGYFTTIDGKSRNRVAELSSSSGAVLDTWLAPRGGFNMVLAPDRIFLGPTSQGTVIAYPLDIGDTIFATHFN
jgi:uncharacterized delta-60 repeat protein